MRRCAAAVLAAASLAAPAAAQRSLGIEGATDERRRGLSWTGGRATAAVDARASLGPAEVRGRVAALRGSERHAGADAVASLSAELRETVAGVELSGLAVAHLFAGASAGMDYVELGGAAAYALGPARAVAGLSYAPSQRSIGGDNLYLYLGLDTGVPGTPLTLVAEVGHTTGSETDPVRAQRLRPGGSYSSVRLSVERRQGPLTLALDYHDTDADRRSAFGPFADARHIGSRLVGRVRFDL